MSHTTVNYNLNVDASASNPAEVGAKVVEAIKQYELRNGTFWRRNTW